jgi:hypothetical protein
MLLSACAILSGFFAGGHYVMAREYAAEGNRRDMRANYRWMAFNLAVAAVFVWQSA